MNRRNATRSESPSWTRTSGSTPCRFEPLQRLDVSEGNRDQNVRTAAHQGARRTRTPHANRAARRGGAASARGDREPRDCENLRRALKQRRAVGGRCGAKLLFELREKNGEVQYRQAEASPAIRRERRQDGVPEAYGRAPSGNRAFARPDRSTAATGLVRFEGRARGHCLRPESSRRRAAVRRQDRRGEPGRKLGQTDRCKPIVAPLSRAIERARSSAAPRDPATSSTSPSRARSRTKRRASASRISRRGGFDRA